MIAVAIAIPVMFLLQTWLSGQVGKLPELDSVTATYTYKSVGANSLLIMLTVSNNGNEPINITNITLVYTQAEGSTNPVIAQGNPLDNNVKPPLSVSPKSSITIPLTISNAAKVNEVIITVAIPGSNATKMIRATGI